MKSLLNLVLVVLVAVAVGLGILALLNRGGGDGAEGIGGAEREGRADGEDGGGGSHPNGETLIFKFREMFDYDASVRVGEGRGSGGITPIVSNAGSKGPIDLAELLVLTEEIERSVTYLADATTQMEQAVGWFVYEGTLHYVLLIRPYEQMAHELMKRPGEDLFVSFLNGKGGRAVPRSAPEAIATRDLRVAVLTEKRLPAGWVTYGELPMQDATAKDIKEPLVGWIFSGGLHARLQRLQRSAMLRDENVRDPFAVEIVTKAKVK